ncbi:hypothetical protein [Achromobacter sp. DH1f]|uniref:DUF7249 family protein n=1 Tax=Achromobacter sp. DH1f TaxID=1397275 RepID=UPI00046A5062|nr:hypothetical protein [Achromobacter sp. DH1f]
MTSRTYQGHKNWNHWNVSLWIGNDEGLYHMARDYIRRSSTKDEAAREMLASLQDMGVTKTPDDAPYSFTTIRAALRGL